MYNLMYTNAVEMIALMPKAQYIATEDQIEGFEEEWKRANSEPVAVLRYKAQSLFNRPLPAPQRVQSSPDIAALSIALQQADNNLKATFGIYDASLGQRGPQESGKAILARQRESDVSNFHYIDNMRRSMRHLGRVLIEAIPKVYSRPGRVIHILNLDETEKAVVLNKPYTAQDGKIKTYESLEDLRDVESGLVKFYDLRVGRFDVAVSTGASYSTQRQEAMTSMFELIRANPQLTTIVAPFMVEAMDWPGARQIAKLLRKMLPPELTEDEEGSQKSDPKMQALESMVSRLTEVVNKQADQIEQKQQEMASKERIALEGNLKDIIISLMREEGSANRLELQTMVSSIKDRLDLLGMREPVVDPAQNSAPVAPAAQPATQ
jgi:hypothetical protein